MVWIFQDGHLGGLGTTATGVLVANIPVLPGVVIGAVVDVGMA